MPEVLIIIFLFLLFFNVILGLFGVLWYSISLRKSETGLRMAVGANKNSIYKQFINEMIILATLAIIPGLLVAIQFPLLRAFDTEWPVYLIAMATSAALIYLFVFLSTLLPGAQASKVQPADALREK